MKIFDVVRKINKLQYCKELMVAAPPPLGPHLPQNDNFDAVYLIYLLKIVDVVEHNLYYCKELMIMLPHPPFTHNMHILMLDKTNI